MYINVHNQPNDYSLIHSELYQDVHKMKRKSMKIFLDTANIKSITQWVDTGIIDGITTNPTHISKEGGDARELIERICILMGDRDVSIEVTESAPDKVYRQAKEISVIAKNVVVKIPCHRDYYKVIKQLVDENVPLNITLIFSVIQSMLMCKLGVRYISPFVGRLDDIDISGMETIAQVREMIDQYGFFATQLLAASIRSVYHVHEALRAGADVSTIPLSVLEKMTQHPLTDKGMQLFLDDWKKLEIKRFP